MLRDNKSVTYTTRGDGYYMRVSASLSTFVNAFFFLRLKAQMQKIPRHFTGLLTRLMTIVKKTRRFKTTLRIETKA